MKKTGMLIGLGALLVVGSVGAAAAWAQGPGRGHMMKHMISARVEEAEDAIQATPAQRTQIEASKDVILNALESKAKGRAEHQKLVALFTADKLDTDALYALANQRAQDVQQLAKVIVPEIQKIHDVLTPAQRQQLAAHIKQMHKGHRGPGPGGFGGPPEE